MHPKSIAPNIARRSVFTRMVLAGLCMALLMGAHSSSAQVDRGGIAGTITDTTGSELPGAKVTIRNVGTNQAVQVLTDNQGNYVAGGLVGGMYSVRIEKNGFKTGVSDGVEVHVNQVVTVNSVLQVGSVTELVEV
ncbi:MAG: carboxypeptidase-like regulatory domain-containing protein, partial [Candidatus Sulfotelmatobacter sp.]